MPQPANIEDVTDRGVSESSEGFGLRVGDMIADFQRREAQDSDLSPRRRRIQAGRKEHAIPRRNGYTRPDNEGSSSTTLSAQTKDGMDASDDKEEQDKGKEEDDTKSGTAQSSITMDLSQTSQDTEVNF